jgi:hypothetical protein
MDLSASRRVRVGHRRRSLEFFRTGGPALPSTHRLLFRWLADQLAGRRRCRRRSLFRPVAKEAESQKASS